MKNVSKRKMSYKNDLKKNKDDPKREDKSKKRIQAINKDKQKQP